MLDWLVPVVMAQSGCDNAGGTDPINLGDCLQLSDGRPVGHVYRTPAMMVSLIAKNAFVIAGIIFFLLIFYSGFKMIQGGQKGFEDAKNILTSAVAGLALMTAAYWIVQLVEYLTGMPIGI